MFDSVKGILDNRGFSDIWESQGNFNSAWLNITLKQRLFDQFQQEWRSNMENSLKGLCYKLFKVNFEELHFVNLELVIIDYLSKQEHGMALIMGIDCVIYAQMQR